MIILPCANSVGAVSGQRSAYQPRALGPARGVLAPKAPPPCRSRDTQARRVHTLVRARRCLSSTSTVALVFAIHEDEEEPKQKERQRTQQTPGRPGAPQGPAKVHSTGDQASDADREQKPPESFLQGRTSRDHFDQSEWVAAGLTDCVSAASVKAGAAGASRARQRPLQSA